MQINFPLSFITWLFFSWKLQFLWLIGNKTSCRPILGFHVTSQALLKSVSAMLVFLGCQIYANNSPFLQWSFSIIALLFRQLHEYSERKKNDKSAGHSSKGIPVLSEYAKSLESRGKERYSQMISVIGVDPASITSSSSVQNACLLCKSRTCWVTSFLRPACTPTSSSRRSRILRRLIKWCRDLYSL